MRAPVPILIATRNAGKAREIAVALRDLPLRVLTLDEADITVNSPERGTTFAANARGKAVFFSSGTEMMTLADDSGLVVDALGGAPGIYSARFSGAGASDGKNIRKLLRLLKNTREDGRGARFVCCMVLARRGHVIKQVTGRVRGRILTAGRGDLGFGYDPVFYYRPLHLTFGELEPEIKNGISHRGRAVRMMADFLRVFSAG